MKTKTNQIQIQIQIQTNMYIYIYIYKQKPTKNDGLPDAASNGMGHVTVRYTLRVSEDNISLRLMAVIVDTIFTVKFIYC